MKRKDDPVILSGKRMVNWSKVTPVPLFLALYVFAFSMTSLWIGDDITYAYSFKDGAYITHLSQVFESQVAHYKLVNGRALAHFLCQLYIPLFGKTAFAVSNALVYVAFLFLTARLCRINPDDWKKMSFLSCLIVLGFRTKFTPTCQIGYLWMFTLIVAFLLIFNKFEKTQSERWNNAHLFWACPLSFLAGWSQESLVLGVIVAIAVHILTHRKQISISQWAVAGCFVAGACFLCLSPGNFGRTDEIHGSLGTLPPALLSLAKLGYYLRITYLLLLLSVYLYFVRRIRIQALFSCSGFYWIIWIIMLAFNLLIGVFGNRQLFGMEFAAMMIIIKYLQEFILPQRHAYPMAYPLLLVSLGVFVFVVIIGNARFLIHHNKVYNSIVTAYKSSEDGTVYLDFSAQDVTFKDTYPSDAFSWYALHTMNRSFGNDNKPLRIIPTLCRRLSDAPCTNSWEVTAPGAMAVIIDKHNVPDKVTIRRSFLKKQLQDMTIDIENPVFENDDNAVVLVYDKMPLVKYQTVLFAHK